METDRRRIEVHQEYPLPYELYYERDAFKYHYIVSIICDWYINVSKFENHWHVLKENDIARLIILIVFLRRMLIFVFFLYSL